MQLKLDLDKYMYGACDLFFFFCMVIELCKSVKCLEKKLKSLTICYEDYPCSRLKCINFCVLCPPAMHN